MWNIHGKIYDLHKYLDLHPGGKNILESCKGDDALTATFESYHAFCDIDKIKNNLLTFLLKQKLKSKVVLAYGAAAKGNTLLNYAGIKSDLIPCIFDAAKSKQGKFLPGSRIPIFPPSKIFKFKPHYDWDGDCNVAIFYINPNNGYTQFETGEKVESVENRLVTFDNKIEHFGTTSTNSQTRIVLNMCY